MDRVLSAEKFSLVFASFGAWLNHRARAVLGSLPYVLRFSPELFPLPLSFAACRWRSAAYRIYLRTGRQKKHRPLLPVISVANTFLRDKVLVLQKRLHIIANVGDCTRPKKKVPCPAATLNACDALMPIIQSASLRACAERNRLSYRLPAFRFCSPSRIALSVRLFIHKRTKGLPHPIYWYM